MKPIEVGCKVVVIGGDAPENLGREAVVIEKHIPPLHGRYDWKIEADGLMGFGFWDCEKKLTDKLNVPTHHIRRIDDWEADEDDTTTIIDMQMTNA